MRRLSIAAGLLSLAVVLGTAVALVPGTAAGTVPAETSTARGPNDLLRVTTESADRMTGVVSRGDYLASFESRRTGPDQVEASVVLDGKRITVSRDRVTGRAVFGGSDAVLVAADRTAVRTLSDALAARWKDRTLPAHGDVLARMVNALTEAPLGVPLRTRVIDRPARHVQTERTPAAGTPTGACEASAHGRAANAAACQRRDEDGIKYFATCRTGKRWFGHDWTGHCYDSAQNNSGPGSHGCFGRCGAGCPGIDRQYTYDCGDHDQCALLHDENLGGCTDEWDEATDDYIHARNNCNRSRAQTTAPASSRPGQPVPDHPGSRR